MAEHEQKLNMTNKDTLNVQSLEEPQADTELWQDEQMAKAINLASTSKDKDEVELEEENGSADEVPNTERQEDAENLELAKLVFKDMMEKQRKEEEDG